MGRLLVKSLSSLSLCSGVILATLRHDGTMPLERDLLTAMDNTVHISGPISLSRCVLMRAGPSVFLDFKEFIICNISIGSVGAIYIFPSCLHVERYFL